MINRLGFTTIAPHGGIPGEISSNTGFSETMLGPKLTFLRNESTNTVAAAGLTFTIPDGSEYRSARHRALDAYPVLLHRPELGRSDYGSFNFMNTTRL